jgi:hypothetical protein
MNKTSFFIKIEIPSAIDKKRVDILKRDLENHIQNTMENYFMLREDQLKTEKIEVKVVTCISNV